MKLFSLIVLVFSSRLLHSTPIELENSRDCEVLEQFFRMGIEEEGYGYVLDGIKPISIRDFYPLDELPFTQNNAIVRDSFIRTLLVKEAMASWEKLCSFQNNYVLKAVPLKGKNRPIKQHLFCKFNLIPLFSS